MFPCTRARSVSRALLLAVLLCLPVVSTASADRNFSVRYSVNETGDIAGIANTLMTCPPGSTSTGSPTVSCAATQSAGVTATANTAYNNNFNMTYVDVDADATTFNSSRATQALPTGAQVLFAGLYWGGDYSTGTAAAPNANARNAVKLQLPGSSTYLDLTADVVDDSTLNIGRYQAYKNVTSLVQGLPNAGNGTYAVANVQAGRGGDRYAGWTLIVAYRDTSQPARNLTVFDGLRTIRSTDAPTNIPVSGFLTPPAGPVRTTVGFVTWEGDHGIVGDSASLNGTVLSDAQHPATNFFNSRISRDGALTTGRDPSYANTLGFDTAFVNADGILPNNASSATIRVTTSGDQYLPGVITFATEIYAPRIVQNKTVTDVNGGTVEQGDVLEYRVSGTNTGQDGATNFVLRDPIPPNTTYVPGSIVLGGSSTPAGGVSDATDTDRGEYDGTNRRVVARLGTGSSGTQGGTIAPNGTYSVTFRVRVNGPALADDPVPSGTVIENVATASYFTQTTGTPLTSTSTASVTTVAPDLRITKTRTGGPVVAGGTNTYTLAVANVGDARTQGTVTVTDPLPDGATATAISAPGWSCSTPPVTAITCSRSDTLAAGASYPTITLTVSFGPGVSGTLSNTATVSGGGDANLTNNTSTDTAPATQSADLALTKTASKTPLVIGETVDFTLRVTNAGPSTATSVAIADALPAGLSFVGATPACTIDPVSGVLGCPVGVLAPGASATVTITARAEASAATTTVTNTATVGAQQADPTPQDNTATADVAVLGADLSIDKTLDSSANPAVGDTVRYTLTARNGGASDATGVVVLDTLPEGLANVSTDDPARCTVAAGVVRCDVGALAAGATFDVEVTGTIAAGTTELLNRATVAGAEADPDPGDNADEVTTPVRAASADLSIVKEADPAQAAAGDTVLFTFRVANAGPGEATGITVSDTLPAGLTYVSGPPNCGAAGQVVTCSLNPIVAGGSRQTGFTVRVAAGATGTIVNTATVDSATADNDPSNNSSSATVAVVSTADVAVTKTVDDAAPRAGDTITYTLVARNAGPATARDVVVSDTLPAGVTYVSDDAGCDVTGATVRCELGDLAAGAQRTIRVRATVDTFTVRDPAAMHQLDIQKVETQFDLEPGQTRTMSVTCPAGTFVADGSVRVDAVDQGTGTLASARIIESRATDLRTWRGTVRNAASGRAQAKIFAVCIGERTAEADGHSHELLVSDPVTATRTLPAGRGGATLPCGPNQIAIQPGFVTTIGDATLGVSAPSGDGWRFAADTTEGAEVEFSIRCLSRTVSTADGHTHVLGLQRITDQVTVPAGGVVETQLQCATGSKGIVGGADLDPGLVSLGNDPRPIVRAFKLFNPTAGPLTARLSLLCLGDRTGGEMAVRDVTNTAQVATSTPESTLANNVASARFSATAGAPAPAPAPLAPAPAPFAAPAPAPAPAFAPAPAPDAPTTATQAPTATAPVSRLSFAPAPVQLRGTTATATLRCAAGRTRCAGTARLTLARSVRLGGRTYRRGTTIATARYAVRAGGRAKLRFRPTASGRRVLRSSRVTRVALRAGSVTRTATVRRVR